MPTQQHFDPSLRSDFRVHTERDSRCEHEYVYGGVKFKVELAPRSGNQYVYFDWFFCEKCLEERLKPLDYSNMTEGGVRFNATPAKEKR